MLNDHLDEPGVYVSKNYVSDTVGKYVSGSWGVNVDNGYSTFLYQIDKLYNDKNKLTILNPKYKYIGLMKLYCGRVEKERIIIVYSESLKKN